MPSLSIEHWNRYRNTFAKTANFKIGAVLENTDTHTKYEIVDFGVRFEEREIVYWLEEKSRYRGTTVKKEGDLYAMELIEEGTSDYHKRI